MGASSTILIIVTIILISKILIKIRNGVQHQPLTSIPLPRHPPVIGHLSLALCMAMTMMMLVVKMMRTGIGDTHADVDYYDESIRH